MTDRQTDTHTYRGRQTDRQRQRDRQRGKRERKADRQVGGCGLGGAGGEAREEKKGGLSVIACI